jgi:hypothetical protein
MKKLFLLVILVLLPVEMVAAQFTYTTYNGTITITGYTGSGGAITIPGAINGVSVTGIGACAFYGYTGLTSIVIPDSVTSLGQFVFEYCPRLASITIGKGVNHIGDGVFYGCASLKTIDVDGGNTYYSSRDGVLFNKSQTTLVHYPSNKAGDYTIPGGVTNIGDWAFENCANLTGVTIPMSVLSIVEGAFSGCTNLTRVIFQGDAPEIILSGFESVFEGDGKAIAYYLPGTTGWQETYGGLPTMMIEPPQISITGMRKNPFGFTITGTSGLVIVVEASTNPANSAWSPIATNTLTGGSSNFSDPNWTNYPARFYRLRNP